MIDSKLTRLIAQIVMVVVSLLHVLHMRCGECFSGVVFSEQLRIQTIMAQRNITADLHGQESNVDIKDLESLLKRSLDDNTLRVIDYEATNLLPPGENYSSTMIKLNVRISIGASEKMLYLVAKTPNPKEHQGAVEWPLVIRKELFVYSELRLLYRELEMESGIEETEMINIWPGYFGHRNSLRDNDEIDEDSLLLMENMKTKGFYNMDRKKGLDVHHARIALTSLAKYHALGIVMKQRRPSFAKRAIEKARPLGLNSKVMDQRYVNLLKLIREVPCLQKYLNVVEASFRRATNGQLYEVVPSEPWATITHGDFWVNNLLFHDDESGKVDDVKFVDFQLYRYDSPQTDLVYFFNGSLDATTQIDHLQELIDIYYDSFIKTLTRMDYDISPFTRDSFDSELKKQAIDQFPLCIFVMKIIIHEVDCDDNDVRKNLLCNIFDSGSSDVLANKLKGLSKMYEKMGWFS